VRKYVVHLGLVSLLLFSGAVVVRVHIAGRSELNKGLSARDGGELKRAQVHFLHAARWYLPLVPTSSHAVEELLTLGDAYLSQSEYQDAVSAYDDARGALYAVAWLGSPDQELLERADDGYSRALALWKRSRNSEVDVENETERYRNLARDVPVTSPWWTLVMGLSFLCYAVLGGYLAWNWDDCSPKKRVCWLGALGALFIVWVISMTLI